MRTGGLRLQMERVLAPRRQTVWRALTEPDRLASWWGPAGFTAPRVELDLRVGGRYRIEMKPPEGDVFFLRGEFREIAPPSRLAYTFRWEEPHPDDRETVVELSLAERDGATALTLEQGPFATEARRALHRGGWSDSLARLAEHLGRGA